MGNTIRLSPLIGFLLLLAGAAPGAWAQERSDRSAPADVAAQCRQSVLRFMDAVNAGDVPGIEAVLLGPTENRPNEINPRTYGRTHLVKCIELQRALERAVAARWGEAIVGEFGGAAVCFTPADRAAVERASVHVPGEADEAHVVTAPGVAPIVLRRSNGQWKISIRTFLEGVGSRRPGEDGPNRPTYLDGVEQALFHAAWLVREKKAETPAAARKALDEALKLAADRNQIVMDDAERAQWNASRK
jgi:hypothetical protein